LKTAALPLLLLSFNAAASAFEPIPFLKEYLAVDSSRGTEAAAALLARPLREAGCEVRLIPSGPGQVNLLALWRGADPSLKPLLLTHHMDTVHPAGPVRTVGGDLRGSGALDDKSLGVAHLAALLEAAKGRPRRGIAFLAVCGEEKGTVGTADLAARGLLPEAAFVLGEGGRNGIAVDRPLFLGYALAEKGALWVTVTVPLPGGHGASPGADGPLADFLGRLTALPRSLLPPRLLPEAREYLTWSAAAIPQRPRVVPTTPDQVEPPQRFLTEVGLNLTAVATDGGLNTLPTTATASFDIRTLRPEDHPAVLALLRERFPKGRLTVGLDLPPVPATPSDDPYVRRFHAVLERELPGLPKGPSPIPGFTDLRHFRAKGIPAAGFCPFFLNYYHESTVHAPEEVLPERRFLEGVRLMTAVVHSLSAE
jgi:acetylornithine deacetylase/succinyl-diaminopimelate desuccinylase-like protein